MAWSPWRVLIVLLPVLLCLSPGRPAAAGSIDISVMTQNLYTGADTDPITMADSDYVCLKKRAALPPRSFFCVSGLRLDQARMLSIDCGNWHSECG